MNNNFLVYLKKKPKTKNKNKGRACQEEGSKCIKTGMCNIARPIGGAEISLI